MGWTIAKILEWANKFSNILTSSTDCCVACTLAIVVDASQNRFHKTQTQFHWFAFYPSEHFITSTIHRTMLNYCKSDILSMDINIYSNSNNNKNWPDDVEGIPINNSTYQGQEFRIILHELSDLIRTNGQILVEMFKSFSSDFGHVFC